MTQNSTQIRLGVSFCFFPRAFERRVLLLVGVCQTFSHLHVCTSHLLIFTFSHPHITSSHLLIFTSSHLHILTSSHLLLLPSRPLALARLPSCPSSPLVLLARAEAVPTKRHETHPFRTKRESPKTKVKIAVSAATLRTKRNCACAQEGTIC